MIERAPWYIAGPLLGLLMVGLRAALNKPFGAVGGYIDFTRHARHPRHLGTPGWLLAGVVAGGALFAVVTGTFSVTFNYGAGGPIAAGQLGLLLGAGVVMGFGARTAGGCTSGHGLNGMSLGSPASVVATMTFFAAAVVLANVVARWGA